MASELITNWSDYQSAIDRILAEARGGLCIFDPDLAHLRLEDPARLALLRQLLQADRKNQICIALQRADFFRQRCPRLLELLRLRSDQLQVVEIPDNLSHLRDCLILADDGGALVRFDIEQARSKLIIDDPEAAAPYLQRFDEIWREGGTPVSATTLGL